MRANVPGLHGPHPQEGDAACRRAGKAHFYGNIVMSGRKKNCHVVKFDGGWPKECSARRLRKESPRRPEFRWPPWILYKLQIPHMQ